MHPPSQTNAKQNLTLASLVCIAGDDEPRVHDLLLGDVLGFDRVRDVRKLIERNAAELETYGTLRAAVARTDTASERITAFAEWLGTTGMTREQAGRKLGASVHTIKAWVHGYRRPGKNSRKIIVEVAAGKISEADLIGTFRAGASEPAPSGYHLNEGQALVICALSRTAQAATIRRALIEVFMAWRRGQLAPPAAKVIPAPIDHHSRNRIRHAKLRLAEAVGALTDLGVDIDQIDLRAVANFYDGFSR